MVGQRFGSYLVLREVSPSYVWCRCDCGVEKQVKKSNIRAGSRRCNECRVKQRQVIRTCPICGAAKSRWGTRCIRCARHDPPKLKPGTIVRIAARSGVDPHTIRSYMFRYGLRAMLRYYRVPREEWPDYLEGRYAREEPPAIRDRLRRGRDARSWFARTRHRVAYGPNNGVLGSVPSTPLAGRASGHVNAF